MAGCEKTIILGPIYFFWWAWSSE